MLLEGEIRVSRKHGDQEIVVARYRPGAFFGEVPLLLGVPYILTVRAESDSRLIVFAEEEFWRLLRLCPAVSSEIFRAMATRLRNLEGSAQQQQKLEALGTMSAGLAHELNNPSSAAQRIAVQLGEEIQTIQSVAHRLHHTEHEHWDRLIALVGEVLKDPSAGRQYHSIEQSDSEDVLAAWLREGGVTDAWKIAPTLVGAGWEMSALVSLRELLPKNAFGDALRWIALRLKIQTLLNDAEQSTGRIASLVEAVRSIARQERAEAADIDVHEQLRSALGVLDRKLTNVRVAQNFSSESGHVRGYPSELAQVWVNLLDNAADAVNGGGEIAIRTRRDDNQTVHCVFSRLNVHYRPISVRQLVAPVAVPIVLGKKRSPCHRFLFAKSPRKTTRKRESELNVRLRTSVGASFNPGAPEQPATTSSRVTYFARNGV